MWTGGACTQGVALNGAQTVTVSPDGESVYVASNGSNGAVAAFDRNLSTGALTQKAGVAACVSSDGSGGECVDGEALIGSNDVTVGPDGRSVYAASATSDGVAVFTRDVPAYDIDGDGQSDPLTDGLLLLRYLFGFTGATLITGAVDLVNCTRCTAAGSRRTSTRCSARERTYFHSIRRQAMDADRFPFAWWRLSIAALFFATPLWSLPPLSQLPGTAGCISDSGSAGACVWAESSTARSASR